MAYDRIAADDEADCSAAAPPPLSKSDAAWMGRLLRERGLRKHKPRGRRNR